MLYVQWVPCRSKFFIIWSVIWVRCENEKERVLVSGTQEIRETMKLNWRKLCEACIEWANWAYKCWNEDTRKRHCCSSECVCVFVFVHKLMGQSRKKFDVNRSMASQKCVHIKHFFAITLRSSEMDSLYFPVSQMFATKKHIEFPVSHHTHWRYHVICTVKIWYDVQVKLKMPIYEYHRSMCA